MGSTGDAPESLARLLNESRIIAIYFIITISFVMRPDCPPDCSGIRAPPASKRIGYARLPCRASQDALYLRPCPYYIHLAQEMQAFFVSNHKVRRCIQPYRGSVYHFHPNYTENCFFSVYSFIFPCKQFRDKPGDTHYCRHCGAAAAARRNPL